MPDSYLYSDYIHHYIIDNSKSVSIYLYHIASYLRIHTIHEKKHTLHVLKPKIKNSLETMDQHFFKALGDSKEMCCPPGRSTIIQHHLGCRAGTKTGITHMLDIILLT